MSISPQDTVSHGLVELSRAECLALLGSRPLGRLVHTQQGLPAIRPVNFVLQPEGIYLRTSDDGSVLRSADASDVVAFEVDDFDAAGRYGWSVVVLGRAQRVTDPLALGRLAELPLVPWAAGRRDQVVRIALELVNGRRVGGPVRLTDPDPR